jgi:hypothetical protein
MTHPFRQTINQGDPGLNRASHTANAPLITKVGFNNPDRYPKDYTNKRSIATCLNRAR